VLNLDLNLSLLQTLRPCPWNGASQGKESVLADSVRAGKIPARVGRVRCLAFLNILLVHHATRDRRERRGMGSLDSTQSCPPRQFRGLAQLS
jgi:hypothetical protein